MSTQTLAQRRAAHALQRVLEHQKAGKNAYGNYVSYVEALPAAILMNGLGQAAATLLAKAEGKLDKPHGRLYADLQDWLCGSDFAAPFRNSQIEGDDHLMQAICQSDQRKYLHAQQEALAWLVWLKKFARAYLERGSED
jgi:CRISPR-associated protein Cmr5